MDELVKRHYSFARSTKKVKLDKVALLVADAPPANPTTDTDTDTDTDKHPIRDISEPIVS